MRIVILFVYLLFATAASATVKHPLNVFVSIAPLRTFVQHIGGQLVQVDVLVQPGQDPHTYEPTSHLVAKLSRADVYMRIGVPFENVWLPRLRAMNPQMAIVDLSAGLNLPVTEHTQGLPEAQEGHAHHEGHDDHDGLDPHIWTSPALVRHMGERVRDYLIQQDPGNIATYLHNYAAFSDDLDNLERDIRSTLATAHRPCSFMVFHPAWGHFAAAYGLTQVAIEQHGKAPGAKTLGNLIDNANKSGLRVIFIQPQFNVKMAQMLATAINGRVEILDPLAEDYFGNLRQVAQHIARACVQ